MEAEYLRHHSDETRAERCAPAGHRHVHRPWKKHTPPGHAASPTWVDIKHEKDNTLPTVEHRVKFEEKRVALQSKNDGTWAFSNL